MTTGRATNSDYSKNKDFIMELYLTFVGTVKNKRTGEPASTRKLV